MYKNNAVDMTDRAITGEAKPAQGIRGRIYEIDEADIKKLDAGVLQKKSTEFIQASQNTKQIPQWMGGRIDEVRNKLPEFAKEDAKTILKAYADDAKLVADALRAKQEGRYVEVANPDGTIEKGATLKKDGISVRDGTWVASDQEGRVRQIASFKDGMLDGTVRNYRENRTVESTAFYRGGQADGTARQYNEKGEVIHRTVYEKGVEKEAKAVDPEKEKAENQQIRTEMRVMSALKIGK